MNRFRLVTVVAAALIVSLPATTATATPPSDIVIEIDTTITDTGSGGPFNASGPAVDDGVFCSSGESFDVFGRATGFQSNNGVNFHIIKALVCDDESGAIFVKLEVRVDRKGDNFRWNVVEGFGAYTDLHGAGSGVGFPTGPDSVFDVFSGKMHND